METDTSLLEGDGVEHHAGEMLGDAGSSGLESSEATQAKAQAIALSKAAAVARARYARLASPQVGLGSSRALQYGLPADGAGTAAGAAAVAAQGRRIGGTEAALAATTVVGQVQRSFPGVTANPIVQAGLPLAPLLLLRPEKRGSGIGAVVADPRVLAVAAVAGLAIASQVMNKKKSIATVRFMRFEPELDQGSVSKFLADALDDDGRGMPGQDIKFSSSDPETVEVDPNGGVKALKPGTATITAIADGKSDFVSVRVPQ